MKFFGGATGDGIAGGPRVLRIFCLAALGLSLSGCLDIFQYITRLDNGADRHIIKITVTTSLLGMEWELEPEEREEKLKELPLMEEYSEFYNIINAYTKYDATVEEINDAGELGYLIKMDILHDEDTVEMIIADDANFMPRYTQDGMIIPLKNLGDGIEDEQTKGVLFGLGRYHLMISKRCMPRISSAAALMSRKPIKGLPPLPVRVFDLGEYYLVNVPLVLFFSNNYRFLMLYSNSTA
ncbi:MAG: hypothetical protein LBP60_03165 [Spirochaetaceae bacterium]|jgi:hypothetical protein|nr:hypothetical protein [Spirochaetaceae bacterium]